MTLGLEGTASGCGIWSARDRGQGRGGAVIRGIRAGFRKFKLFMITNLPGEEPEDVMMIVELGRLWPVSVMSSASRTWFFSSAGPRC